MYDTIPSVIMFNSVPLKQLYALSKFVSLVRQYVYWTTCIIASLNKLALDFFKLLSVTNFFIHADHIFAFVT